MNTNMSVRHYLTQNADEIILNNQNAAVGNCNNILLITDRKSISSVPILFDTINIYPSFDNNSDLKISFINFYNSISNMFSPSISY